ncbi:MAG: chorismate synthase [Pyramidobacter sp.]|jgi:chorismate synthase
MSSSWGEKLRITLFGQSHSAAVGVVVQGLPAGFPVDRERLGAFMRRRAPGRSPLATPRKEDDCPEFLSGLSKGRLCGAPLCMVIRNADVRPADYSAFVDVPRPGHADYTAAVKYGGFQDSSGGGHFSGRLTAPLTAVGGICLQILESLGVFVGAHVAAVGKVRDRPFDPVTLSRGDFEGRIFEPLTVLDGDAGERMAELIAHVASRQDSVGGIVECGAVGLPAGLGDPIFGGLENRIASLVFGIPAVKGVEFGSGFGAASMLGSQHNDRFVAEGGAVRTATNNHGGILGGISSGMPLIFRAAFKPTPSISLPQKTLNVKTMEETELRIGGRHDPCIVPRAVPCVEAAAAVALCDALLPGDCRPLEGGMSHGA